MFNFCLCLYFIYPRQSYATVEIHPYYRPVYAEVLNFYALRFLTYAPFLWRKVVLGITGYPLSQVLRACLHGDGSPK